jgi:hypothetical protein
MNQIDNIMELYEEAAAAMCNVVKNPGDKYWLALHKKNSDALRAAIESALGSGEPIGWAWQHDETGRTMCNLNDGINTPEDFKKANPRWHLVSPLYRAPQPQPKQEPFGYFKAEPFGWTDCAETDEGAIALYDAPQPQPWSEVVCPHCNGSGLAEDAPQPPCKTGSQCTSKCQRCSVIDWEVEAGKQAMLCEEYKALLRQALEMMEDNHHLVADNEKHAYVRRHLAVIEALRERLDGKR